MEIEDHGISEILSRRVKQMLANKEAISTNRPPRAGQNPAVAKNSIIRPRVTNPSNGTARRFAKRAMMDTWLK